MQNVFMKNSKKKRPKGEPSKLFKHRKTLIIMTNTENNKNNKKSVKICVKFLLVLLISMVVNASAEPVYDKVYAEYPKKSYIVGIGETSKTDSFFKDKRVAEVLARVEIARQIKVKVKETTLDIACEGSIGKIFGNSLECKNEFVMIIEQSVNEVLVGSRIVNHGERDGIVYAVAILPRGKASKGLEKDIQDSINKARESIKKAKEGDRDSLKKAQEEYMKAVTYDKERDIIKGVKGHATELFNELEKEIKRLLDTDKH